MKRIGRREFVSSASKVAVGAFALTLARVLERPGLLETAAAQTPGHVQATFVALVEAVTTDPDEATAAWIIGEFDAALPPLPQGSPSSAVAALLDSYTVQGGHGATFASADPDARRSVLGDMVKDPSPDIQQVANQVIPFSSFAYWSEVGLDGPAKVGGKRLPQWRKIGFPGPSHGYLDDYRRGGPKGFRARRDFQR